MTAPSASERIRIIERSLRCFVFGLLSLIPVLGVPMSLLAWWHGHAVHRTARGKWNPARRYAVWGSSLAWWGFVVTFFLFPRFLVALANAQPPP
jgi:hypothetical protein